MKKIILIGGSGFIGSHLAESMKDAELKLIHGKEIMTSGTEKLSKIIDGYDLLINVAGRSIFTFWTRKKKDEMYRSRVDLTRKLVESMSMCKSPPKHFLSASSIGIYRGETEVTEKSGAFADNFLANLVNDWEKEIFKARELNIQVTAMRFGIVLGKEGGAYRIMRSLSRLNLGGYFGKGDQSMSFIYIHDLVRAVSFIIQHEITGVVNLVTEKYSCYKEVFTVLKKQLDAMIVWRIPEFIPELFLGEASLLYLEGQKVFPEVLTKNNYNFEASNIRECVKKIEAN